MLRRQLLEAGPGSRPIDQDFEPSFVATANVFNCHDVIAPSRSHDRRSAERRWNRSVI
jgi:hypothetical protein